jgi:hypothetical protein
LTGQLFEAKVWDDGPASSLFFIDATSANCLSVPHSDAVEDFALMIQLHPGQRLKSTPKNVDCDVNRHSEVRRSGAGGRIGEIGFTSCSLRAESWRLQNKLSAETTPWCNINTVSLVRWQRSGFRDFIFLERLL